MMPARTHVLELVVPPTGSVLPELAFSGASSTWTGVAVLQPYNADAVGIVSSSSAEPGEAARNEATDTIWSIPLSIANAGGQSRRKQCSRRVQAGPTSLDHGKMISQMHMP